MIRITCLAIVLMLSSLATQAQNYIGMSKDIVIHQLKTSFDFGEVEIDVLDNLKIIKYASNDQKTRKVFFLDDAEKCSKFIVIHNDLNSLKVVKRDLNKNYERESKNTWIQRGIIDYRWQLDKKQKFFALVVTKSFNNEQVTMNVK
ncbi:MAG: hypothetical protein HOG05_13790 [Bacteroidetes bacterium]|jgi:hypothetical protein|nr:hypothetical protein [Bacteroidota bacterium]MBT3421194.1 hypothetical protein [Bacteroidota bacterium]MBT3802218.1 hypothetical protein [Bacteroidota bacterium]MBT4726911.1 hypothetical protein [Bacteroidota bacterium]MBT5991814.1 hypothetical protein [Bacteroidota bacterium]